MTVQSLTTVLGQGVGPGDSLTVQHLLQTLNFCHGSQSPQTGTRACRAAAAAHAREDLQSTVLLCRVVAGDGVHILTGPIYVCGAEPGDVLQVGATHSVV